MYRLTKTVVVCVWPTVFISRNKNLKKKFKIKNYVCIKLEPHPDKEK